MFRFSLKRMLLCVAYIAVTLTACIRASDDWAYAIWLLNGCVVLYAVLAIAFRSGKARAMAAGFALFSLAYTAAVKWSPEVLPTNFVDQWLRPLPAAQDRAERLAWEVSMSHHAANSEYRDRVRREYQLALDKVSLYQRYQRTEHVLDAALMVAAGLVGSLAGAHVWRSAQIKVRE